MTRLINSVWASLLLVALLLAIPSRGYCQDGQGFEVIALEFVDAEEIHELVVGLAQGDAPRIVVDRRLNRIYAQGHPNSIKMLRQLVAEVDIAKPKTETNSQIKIFQLAHAAAQDVALVIGNLATRQQADSLRLSVDENANSLIVSGTQAELDVLEKLIARIDQAGARKQVDIGEPENVIVRVSWLVDSTNIGSDTVRNALRDTLPEHQNLASALAAPNDAASMKSLTASETSVQINPANQRANQFDNTSMRNIQNEMHIMSAKGHVRQAANGKYELEISLDLMKNKVNLSVGSTITLPKNHPVAFSVTDVGDFRSVAVVEILDGK